MTAVSEVLNIPRVMVEQFADPRRIVDRQSRRLTEFIEASVSTVPYYADRYRPETPRSIHDFQPLTKQVLRQVGSQNFLSKTFADHPELLVWTNTSGTTGKRIEIAHDPLHFSYHNTACIRRFLATGRYRPWFRLLHFRPIGMPERWYQRLGMFRRTVVLSSLPPRTLIDAALDMRPQAIIGYPTTLRDLARRMTNDERRQIGRHLRIIFTESEMLIPAHRRQIEDWYGAPVFDEYSAYEVLNVTFECSARFAHIAEDRIFLEVLDDDDHPLPDGQEGRIVITAFRERAMPLIRYDLADRGRLIDGRCPCGRTFKRLDLTEGRSDQHITLPDGSVISVGTFLYLAAEQPGVAESMVRQDAAGRITVSVVAEAGADYDEVIGDFEQALHRLAGRPFEVDFTSVESIPLSEGGKGRFLESEYQPVGRS